VDPVEQLVRARLAALPVEHDIVACDPALADTADFCAAYGYAPEDSANTIVVIGKSSPPRYVACVLLATTRLDVNGAVRRRLGVKKASFAGGDDTRSVTGMALGGVTPFGLPDDMAIWVDERVMARERIVLGGGSRACKVVGPPGLLTALPGVEVVSDLAVPAAPRSPEGPGGPGGPEGPDLREPPRPH
jgi:prolyl-tRNA editing enzyme YbaK/EbsC (Cys-tRNA(Pro) deacylase)